MTATIGGVAPALDQSPVLEAVDERDEIARMHAQGGGELRLGGGVLLGERVEQRVLVGVHAERVESGTDPSAGGAPETEHEQAARRRLRGVGLARARSRRRVRGGGGERLAASVHAAMVARYNHLCCKRFAATLSRRTPNSETRLMDNLLLIPLDDSVIFPGMTVTLALDAGDEDQVLLVPRKGEAFADVGTVAEVSERVRLPGGASALQLTGLHRGSPGAAATDAAGDLRVAVEARPDESPPPTTTRELEREYRAVVGEILELRGDDGRIAAFMRSITEAGALADTAGYSPDLTYDEKVELLERLDVVERLELATRLQRERLAEMQVRQRIRDDVRSGAESQQREYFMRKQMESIRRELGEDEE